MKYYPFGRKVHTHRCHRHYSRVQSIVGRYGAHSVLMFDKITAYIRTGMAGFM